MFRAAPRDGNVALEGAEAELGRRVEALEAAVDSEGGADERAAGERARRVAAAREHLRERGHLARERARLHC